MSGRGAAGLLALAAFLHAAPASAAGCRLEKVAGAEETLERRVAAGEGNGWLINRREPSARTQARVDGIILAPAGSSLKMKAIRHRDGDQRFLLGAEGKPPEPVAGWAKTLPLIRREPLAGYRLVSPAGEEMALLLAPHGAEVTCVEQDGASRVEVRRPEEEQKSHFSGEGRFRGF